MTLTYYRDKQGKFRWNLKARNGRIVAESGQGYKSKAACRRGWALTNGSFMAEIVENW